MDEYFDEQIALLRACRKAYERIQQIPNHKPSDYGEQYEQIVRQFMSLHVPRDLKLVSKARIDGYEIDLTLVKDSTFNDRNLIPPSAVHAIIEVKGFGAIISKREEASQWISKQGFHQILKEHPNIHGAYLAIRERVGGEKSHHKYIRETKDFLGSHAFILSEGDMNFEKRPYQGEWKRFLDYVVSE
jgi:hypothetical protein